MELKDLFTIGLSSVAFLFSILTLILVQRWTKEGRMESWEREVKIPFYTKLSIFLDKLDTIYVVDEGRNAKKHNYTDFSYEADVLGLDEISKGLIKLEFYETRIRGEKFKKGVQEKTLNNYRDEILKILEYIEKDRIRLTKKI